jgi:hypothetical protein
VPSFLAFKERLAGVCACVCVCVCVCARARALLAVATIFAALSKVGLELRGRGVWEMELGRTNLFILSMAAQ